MAKEYPHDLEAERSLLGAMLISKSVCNEVLTTATGNDFYLDAHRILFDVMHEVSRKNMPVDQHLST